VAPRHSTSDCISDRNAGKGRQKKRERKGNKIEHETMHKKALESKNFQEGRITDILKNKY
jgi:hypothetical protein